MMYCNFTGHIDTFFLKAANDINSAFTGNMRNMYMCAGIFGNKTVAGNSNIFCYNPRLLSAERSAYDKILSFLVFLDSIQTANLPNIGAYITANEVNLCLSIQAFQECVHSQSYSYMLDTICSPVERNDILYQWKTDEHLLRRNTFIGDCYNEFQERKDAPTLLRVMMANYILEGIYFYSGFMFFYNLSRNGKMSGSAQEIRYINRDENTHLWLFRNIITELQKEQPELFTAETTASEFPSAKKLGTAS